VTVRTKMSIREEKVSMNIYVMNADRTRQKRLTLRPGDSGGPDWRARR